MLWVAVAAIASVCVVLALHDRRPTPSFAYGLSLNAVTAFLSVIARVALTTVAAEILHQNKWLWIIEQDHKSPRSLSVLQAFESAARGPLGFFVASYSETRKLVNMAGRCSYGTGAVF